MNPNVKNIYFFLLCLSNASQKKKLNESNVTPKSQIP